MKAKEKKTKRPMSLTKRVVLSILAVAVIVTAIYLIYYFVHYVFYNKYEQYVDSYEYEQGSAYAPIAETQSDVPDFELVAESEYLKLYTQPSTAIVAVYDKRNGETTYTNPLNADEDTVANAANVNYLKSQFLLYYYNEEAVSGTMATYNDAVRKNQFTTEGIANGIRYIYHLGEIADNQMHFEVPLEYRLHEDYLEVSIPASGIKEYNNGYIYRIQLLRYMGATSYDDEGYIVVPNGSGSIINFNNGKRTAASYSQYIYDIDPLAANYTTTEILDPVRMALFGICKENYGMLVTVEDGASNALITAGISGVYNDLNYVYPSFVLRVADNLRMFGNSTSDVYVIEPSPYDVNMTVRYTFLPEEYKGYAGLANYYRERLVEEGKLTRLEESGDIPFFYDVIAGVKENAHFLGVQYLHTFSMTDFDEAAQMSDELAASGISRQVMNLQGWFNGGYYHDAADKVRIIGKLGGKSGLEDLNETVTANGGDMYVDVAFQQVTFADDGFNYGAEGSRYYGAGYVASFGLINPTTLRNTSGLGYTENRYDLLSPKFLPRYVGKFVGKIDNIDVTGISLRDLGSVLVSDKKRTHQITREAALDVVLGQLDSLEDTGKKIMTNAGNDYSFAYTDTIINAPISGNSLPIIDADIPLYEMITHGYITSASGHLNFMNRDDMGSTTLNLVEFGVAPHYVFTWERSSEMKNTALNRFYTTTFSNWKDTAVETYVQVNEALKHVSNAAMVGHDILDNNVRKVTYDNGVVIYINYSQQEQQADGLTIPAMSYRLEGK
ncbi:MAG: hypothetical protein K2O34_07765 [Acetatifactor sp.]|nr:hypothetical protein [Acetatifactor sp.]